MLNYDSDYNQYQIAQNNENMPQDISKPPLPRIVFFLGAGASVKAGIPTMERFIEDFKKDLKRNNKGLYKEYLKIEDLLKKSKKLIDLETIIESLELLTIDMDNQNIIIDTFFGEIKSTINTKKIDILKKDLMSFIRKKTFINDTSKIKYLDALNDLIEFYGPLDIFTVNYDTCIELLAHSYGLKYTDGFELYWNSKLFDNKNYQIYLYKIHGSATWYQTDANTYIKIPVKNLPDNVHTLTGEKGATLIIYPSREKYSFVEPLSEISHYFRKIMKQAEICIVAGYSMRDDSINTMFQEAIRNNNDLILIFISTNAGKYYNELLKKGLFYKNRIIPIEAKFEDVLKNNNLFNIIGNLFKTYEQTIKYKEAKIKGNLYNDLKINTALSFSNTFFVSIAEKFLDEVNLNEVGLNKSNLNDVSNVVQLLFQQIILNYIIKNKENLNKDINILIKILKKFIPERMSENIRSKDVELPKTITYEILHYDIQLNNIVRPYLLEQFKIIEYFKTFLSNDDLLTLFKNIENKIIILKNVAKIIEKLRILIASKDQDVTEIINDMIRFSKNCGLEHILPERQVLETFPQKYIKTNDCNNAFLKSKNERQSFDHLYRVFLKTYKEYYAELESFKNI